MLGFLKVFLQGILYVVLLPLIVAILAIYAVYCAIVFIYIAIRSIIVFFMGGTPLGDLPEDVEAKRILLERAQVNPADSAQMLADAITRSQAQFAQSFASQQPLSQPKPEPIIEETSDLEQPDFSSIDEDVPETIDEYKENLEENNDDQSY